MAEVISGLVVRPKRLTNDIVHVSTLCTQTVFTLNAGEPAFKNIGTS